MIHRLSSIRLIFSHVWPCLSAFSTWDVYVLCNWLFGVFLTSGYIRVLVGCACRIPAVGFPALVGGHHVPVHPASNSDERRQGKESSRKSGSKRSRRDKK